MAQINQAISNATVGNSVVTNTGDNNAYDLSQHVHHHHARDNNKPISDYLNSQQQLPQTLCQSLTNQGLCDEESILRYLDTVIGFSDTGSNTLPTNVCILGDREELKKYYLIKKSKLALTRENLQVIRKKLKVPFKKKEEKQNEFVDVKLQQTLLTKNNNNNSSSKQKQQQELQHHHRDPNKEHETSMMAVDSGCTSNTELQMLPASSAAPSPNQSASYSAASGSLTQVVTDTTTKLFKSTLTSFSDAKESVAAALHTSSTNMDTVVVEEQNEGIKGCNLISYLQEKVSSNNNNNDGNDSNKNNVNVNISPVAIVESPASYGKTFLFKQLVLSQPEDAPVEDGIRIFCPLYKMKNAKNFKIETRADLLKFCCKDILNEQEIEHICRGPIKCCFLFDSFDTVQNTDEEKTELGKFLHNFIDPVQRNLNIKNSSRKTLVDTNDLILVSSREDRVDKDELCNFTPQQQEENIEVVHFSIKRWTETETKKFAKNFFEIHFDERYLQENNKLREKAVEFSETSSPNLPFVSSLDAFSSPAGSERNILANEEEEKDNNNNNNNEADASLGYDDTEQQQQQTLDRSASDSSAENNTNANNNNANVAHSSNNNENNSISSVVVNYAVHQVTEIGLKSNNMEHFSGIPQMMRMLCEIFKENAVVVDVMSNISPSIAFERMFENYWNSSQEKLKHRLSEISGAYSLKNPDIASDHKQRVKKDSFQKAMDVSYHNLLETQEEEENRRHHGNNSNNNNNDLTLFVSNLEDGLRPELWAVLFSETPLMSRQSDQQFRFSTPSLVEYFGARYIFENKQFLSKLPWNAKFTFVWILLADLVMVEEQNASSNSSSNLLNKNDNKTSASSSSATTNKHVSVSEFITAVSKAVAKTFGEIKSVATLSSDHQSPPSSLCFFDFLRLAMILKNHVSSLLKTVDYQIRGLTSYYNPLGSYGVYIHWSAKYSGVVGAKTVLDCIERDYPTAVTADTKKIALSLALDHQHSPAVTNFITVLLKHATIPVSLSHSVKCNSLVGTTVAVLNATKSSSSSSSNNNKFDALEWSKLLRFAITHRFFDVAGTLLFLTDEWKNNDFASLHLIVSLLSDEVESFPFTKNEFVDIKKEDPEFISALVKNVKNRVVAKLPSSIRRYDHSRLLGTEEEKTQQQQQEQKTQEQQQESDSQSKKESQQQQEYIKISRDRVAEKIGADSLSTLLLLQHSTNSKQQQQATTSIQLLSRLQLLTGYSRISQTVPSLCWCSSRILELSDRSNEQATAAFNHLFSLKDSACLADNTDAHNALFSAFVKGFVQRKDSLIRSFCQIVAGAAKVSEKNVFGSKEIRKCLSSCVLDSGHFFKQEKEEGKSACTSSCTTNTLLSPETAEAWCTAVANILDEAEGYTENKKRYGRDALVHDAVLQIVPSIKTSEAANAWCCCVNLLAEYKPNLPKFSDDEIKDAFVKISETLLSSDAASSFSSAIGQICKENVECKTRFGLDEKIRGALVAVSLCIDTEEHAPSWLNVVLSLVSFSPEVTKLYAVENFRDAFVSLYNRLEYPTSAIGDCICKILYLITGAEQRDHQHLFATTEIRDLLAGGSSNSLSHIIGTDEATKCWLQTLLQIVSDNEEILKLFVTSTMRDSFIGISSNLIQSEISCRSYLICLRQLTSTETAQHIFGASVRDVLCCKNIVSLTVKRSESIEAYCGILENLASFNNTYKFAKVGTKVREHLCSENNDDDKLYHHLPDAICSVASVVKEGSAAALLMSAVRYLTLDVEENKNKFATTKFRNEVVMKMVDFLPSNSSALRSYFKLVKQLADGNKNRREIFSDRSVFSKLCLLRSKLKNEIEVVDFMNALTAISIDNAIVYDLKEKISFGPYDQLKQTFLDIAEKEFWGKSSEVVSEPQFHEKEEEKSHDTATSSSSCSVAVAEATPCHSEAAEAWLRCLYTIIQKNENNKQNYGNPSPPYTGTNYCHQLASSFFKIGTKHATTNTTVKLVCDIIYDLCEDSETNKECSVVVGKESASLKYATTHWTYFSKASYIDGRKLVLASTPSATMIPDLFVALARSITDISAATSWIRSLNHLCSFYVDHKKHFTENAKCRQAFCSISRFVKEQQQKESTSATSNSSSSNQADKAFDFIFSWSQCLVSLLATKESQQHFLADTGAELAFALKDLAVSIVENSSSSSSSEKRNNALKCFLTAMFGCLHFYSKFHAGVSVQSCESQYLFFNELNLDCLVKIVDVILVEEQSEQKQEVCKLWLLCVDLFVDVSSRAADKIRLGNDADIYITLKKLCCDENNYSNSSNNFSFNSTRSSFRNSNHISEKVSAVRRTIPEDRKNQAFIASVWVEEKLNATLLMESNLKK